MWAADVRAIWIDRGNDAPYHALTKHQITDPYYDVRDPRLNLNYLNGVVGRGFRPGLYACSQGDGWPNPTTMSGPAWADWVYEKVQVVIAPGTMGSYPRVCLNIESHDVENWVLPALKRWRKKSPRRETYWALEGRQGGLFKPEHVTAINALGIGVCVEFFRGDMTPHGPGVIDEMLKLGFAPERLWAFWDAAALSWSWQGMAFTAGRLPA